MDFFTHLGKKAVLITSEDLLHDYNTEFRNKIEKALSDGVVFFFVCTNLRFLGLPKVLRDIAADVEIKNCFLIIKRE